MITENLVGKEIGKYRLDELVGCGGMGTLYRAQHTTLEKTVALKILHPNLTFGDQGERIAARFLREARTAAQLKHPNIVEVYDIEEQDGLLYIVMEFILGKSIQEILQEKNRIPLAESLYIAIEVAKGLQAAHNRGIIHRDVKPANMMITKDGMIKLTDFGLARVNDDVALSVAEQVCGTPLYSAPEQVDTGSEVDFRADLYSLGVSLFQMLAGETPYSSNNAFNLMTLHLTGEIPSVREKDPAIPPVIDKLIVKLMAKDPIDRYPNALDLTHELNRYAGIVTHKKLDMFNVLERSLFFKEVLEQPTAPPEPQATVEETLVDATVQKDVAEIRNITRCLQQSSFTREEPIEPEKDKIIKVLIVDDSSMMRKAIKRSLEKFAGIHVIGTAKHGKEALELMPTLNPDVVTLDVNMPVMDGITTLKHIAVQFPHPVVMLSAFTHEGAITTFDCLTLGAIDFICKPSQAGGKIDEQIESLVGKIQSAARVHVKPTKRMRIKKSATNEEQILKTRPNAEKIVVMGAGAGADGAYLRIIPYIMKKIPCAIVAVQYMDPQIFPSFCEYLNSYSRIIVKKLENKEIFKKGVCYLINAPEIFTLKSSLLGTYCNLLPSAGPRNNVVDKITQEIVGQFGPKTTGVLLAGKEEDGIDGLIAIKQAGGHTLAQDPKTCNIPDNIYRAMKKNCIDRLVAESDIPAMLWHLLKDK